MQKLKTFLLATLASLLLNLPASANNESSGFSEGDWVEISLYCTDLGDFTTLIRQTVEEGSTEESYLQFLDSVDVKCFDTNRHGGSPARVEIVEILGHFEAKTWAEGAILEMWVVRDREGTVGWTFVRVNQTAQGEEL